MCSDSGDDLSDLHIRKFLLIYVVRLYHILAHRFRFYQHDLGKTCSKPYHHYELIDTEYTDHCFDAKPDNSHYSSHRYKAMGNHTSLFYFLTISLISLISLISNIYASLLGYLGLAFAELMTHRNCILTHILILSPLLLPSPLLKSTRL